MWGTLSIEMGGIERAGVLAGRNRRAAERAAPKSAAGGPGQHGTLDCLRAPDGRMAQTAELAGVDTIDA
jgi:hypothetical protein